MYYTHPASERLNTSLGIVHLSVSRLGLVLATISLFIVPHGSVHSAVITAAGNSPVRLAAANSEPVLPQSEPYMVVLRDWMASLSEADFDVPLQPLVFDDSEEDEEELFKLWIMCVVQGPQMPRHTLAQRRSQYFTLQSIEAGGTINMTIGFRNSGWARTMHGAWWADWDYPGNPYYQSFPLMRRALVAAAVEMMMTDHEVFFRNHAVTARTDYMGARMTEMTYPYYVAKKHGILPQHVEAAFETGLLRFFEKMEQNNAIAAGGGNMAMHHLPAMWWIAEAIGTQDLKDRALARIKYVLEFQFNNKYYHRHIHNFYDATYAGRSIGHAIGAALMTQDDEIIEYVRNVVSLKTYMTLIDPDGYELGPSHFSTSTADGAGRDQAFSPDRDIAAGFFFEDARFLTWQIAPNGGRGGALAPLRTQAQMKSRIRSQFNAWNNDLSASNGSPGVWRNAEAYIDVHERLPWLWTNWPQGYLQVLRDMDATQSPQRVSPYLRGESFTKEFVSGDRKDFFIIGRPGWSAIIHTGPLASALSDRFRGMSGGGLSAFYTPETGSVILGLSNGSQNHSTPGPDWWIGPNDWERWAVHAINGLNSDGKPFSSAPFRAPVSVYNSDPTHGEPHVVVSGSMGNSATAPDDALTGVVNYERRFWAEEYGLRVRTELVSDGTDDVSQLWEIIPIFLRRLHSTADPNALIDFKVEGSWVLATESSSINVESVRLTRYGNSVYIHFAQPVSARLGPVRSNTYGTNHRTRQLMIDLLGNGTQMPEYVSVEYALSISEERPKPATIPDVSADFSWAMDGRHVSFENASLANSAAENVSLKWYFGDGSTSTERHPVHSYARPGEYQVLHVVNGADGIHLEKTATLAIVDDAFDVQEISLKPGWNLISSYIEPYDSTIPDVFSGISEELIIVKNWLGKVYSPRDEIDDIGEWRVQEAYLVNVARQQQLTLYGRSVTRDDVEIKLTSGWNVLPVLSEEPRNVSNLFEGYEDNVIAVKDENGNTYLPAWGINQINMLIPGNGYQIAVTDDMIIKY